MLTFKEYTRAIDIWSVGCILAEMLSGKPLFPGRDCELCHPPKRFGRKKTSSNVILLSDFRTLTHLCCPLLADHHQLSIILDILGTPSLDDFYAISSPRSREYIRALPFRKKKPFSSLFPNANPLAIDLLEKCLTFSPKKRIQVDEALQHPYLEVSIYPHCYNLDGGVTIVFFIKPYHDPMDEPTAPPLDPSFFDFDNGNPLSKEELKGTFSAFHPHAHIDRLPPELIYQEVTRSFATAS